MAKDKKIEEVVNENVEQNNCCADTDKLKAQLLRVSADFENYKRRIDREKRDWLNMAQADLLERFLPFSNDLSRAMDACKREDEDGKLLPWVEGFEIIQKNLEKTFTDVGVTEIDCLGQFDPEFHEALVQIDSKDHESGQVVEVFNKGYMFKDKVLKHAKVSVAK